MQTADCSILILSKAEWDMFILPWNLLSVQILIKSCCHEIILFIFSVDHIFAFLIGIQCLRSMLPAHLIFWRQCLLLCVFVSFSEVFGEEGRVPGAGRGPCRGTSSEQPPHRLCATASEEPSCSLAAHHYYHHHGLLSALWPQRCKIWHPCFISFTLIQFFMLFLIQNSLFFGVLWFSNWIYFKFIASDEYKICENLSAWKCLFLNVFPQ